MDMSRYVTKSESCDWCHLGKCVRVCASAGASVTQCQLSSRTGRRGEQSDCLLGTFVYICCFYLITPYSGFLSGTTKLSFNTSAPPANAMYYPQQSPGIAHKLSSTHPDPSPWARPTHPFGPPPPSPGYPLYTNGNIPHHMQSLHHHQNSISHYPSPPSNNGVAVNVLGQPIGVGQGSPGSASSQIITPHWQQ